MKLDARKLKMIRILLSPLLFAIALIFISLSALSAANYTDVVYAKLSAGAHADMNIAPSGLDSSGELLNSSAIWFNATINITNPSAKAIVLQFVKFQGWVRNYRIENLTNSSTKIFYSALVRNASYQANEGFVEPRSTKPFLISWRFDNTERAAFQEARRILNYAMTSLSPPVSWNQVEWNQFYVFQLVVSGVPSDYYGPNSGYLIELPVIWRYQGSNIAGG